MSNLYYIAANDADGENQDMFVSANSAVEAFEMWHVDRTSQDIGFRANDLVRVFSPPTPAGFGVIDWDKVPYTIIRISKELAA